MVISISYNDIMTPDFYTCVGNELKSLFIIDKSCTLANKDSKVTPWLIMFLFTLGRKSFNVYVFTYSFLLC